MIDSDIQAMLSELEYLQTTQQTYLTSLENLQTFKDSHASIKSHFEDKDYKIKTEATINKLQDLLLRKQLEYINKVNKIYGQEANKQILMNNVSKLFS